MEARRFKVKLTFFKKDSGKYYSGAEREIVGRDFWDVVSHARNHHKAGTLPGLERGGRGFNVLVEVEGVPHLLLEV